MATVKVFGSPTSAEVARVLMCLFEKDIDFQLIRVDTFRGTKRMPDYLKLQPRGEALTMEDGQVTLVESRRICQHLVDRFPELGNRELLGRGALERAEIEQWLQTEAQSFDPPSRDLIFSLAFVPDAFDGDENKWWPNSKQQQQKANNKLAGDETKPNQKQPKAEEKKKMEEMRTLADVSRKELEVVLDIYDQRLQEMKYLAGDLFTLADLSHLPNAQRLHGDPRGRKLISSRKHVNRWWNDISSREAWKRVLDMQRAPAPPPVVRSS